MKKSTVHDIFVEESRLHHECYDSFIDLIKDKSNIKINTVMAHDMKTYGVFISDPVKLKHPYLLYVKSKIVNKYEYNSFSYIYSWGITQHTDNLSDDITIIIPIHYDGYRLANSKYTKELDGMPEMIDTKKMHSLAPYKKVSKPFIGLSIGLVEV